MATTLPISADELAEYCITSFDRLPPVPVDDGEGDREYYEDLKEQHLYQSSMLRRLKVRLVKLYGLILKKAYGTVSTVLLMEHVLAELEDLMCRNHPRGRNPFVDMADALELIFLCMCNTSGGVVVSAQRLESIIDTLLDGRIGSFLLVRAHRRVGTVPDENLIADHDAFAYGERLTVRRDVLNGYYGWSP